MSSEGTVTGWDPPRRLVYEEPAWAALAGKDPATVTPLVSEFLVEATSGGTCVVCVVSGAFGSGADWEREFFDEMSTGWAPMFDLLRLYLGHFPGQRVATLEASADLPASPEAAMAAVRAALGVEGAGQTLDVRGAKAQVARGLAPAAPDRTGSRDARLLRLGAGENTATVRVAGYLFADDAAAYVERETPQLVH